MNGLIKVCWQKLRRSVDLTKNRSIGRMSYIKMPRTSGFSGDLAGNVFKETTFLSRPKAMQYFTSGAMNRCKSYATEHCAEWDFGSNPRVSRFLSSRQSLALTQHFFNPYRTPTSLGSVRFNSVRNSIPMVAAIRLATTGAPHFL